HAGECLTIGAQVVGGELLLSGLYPLGVAARAAGKDQGKHGQHSCTRPAHRLHGTPVTLPRGRLTLRSLEGSALRCSSPLNTRRSDKLTKKVPQHNRGTRFEPASLLRTRLAQRERRPNVRRRAAMTPASPMRARPPKSRPRCSLGLAPMRQPHPPPLSTFGVLPVPEDAPVVALVPEVVSVPPVVVPLPVVP